MTAFPFEIMKPPENMKFYRAKGKMLGMQLVGPIVFGVCFLVSRQQVGAGKTEPVTQYLFWCAFGFFCVVIPFFSAVTTFFGKPVIELSKKGVLVREVAAEVIPWTAIRSVSIVRTGNQKLFEFKIDPQVVRGLRRNFFPLRFRFFNGTLGLPYEYASAYLLDHHANYILDCIDFHLRNRVDTEARAI